jgi:chitodextrinase
MEVVTERVRNSRLVKHPAYSLPFTRVISIQTLVRSRIHPPFSERAPLWLARPALVFAIEAPHLTNFHPHRVTDSYHDGMPETRGAPLHRARAQRPFARLRLRHVSLAAVVIASAGFACMGMAAQANAATTSCNVSSLITAISAANAMPSGGSVSLTGSCVYTLTTSNNATDGATGLPVINGKVTIQGNGAVIARTSATNAPAFRLFDVAARGSLTLNSLTMRNGLANNGTQGGGAINNHGTVSVTAGTFTGNSSPATTGTSGGAIDSSGVLTVTTSTFSGNSAQEGGGIFNQDSSTVSDSTFTNNQAQIYGGGASVNAAGSETFVGDTFVGNTGPGGGAIDNDAALNVSASTFFNNTGGSNGGGAIENFGTTTLTQSTFSGNTSPFGANIFNFTGFTLAMKMDIVAGGLVGNNCGGQAPITDLGYNMDTGASCGFSVTNHSLSNIQPRLEPLASNGGLTQTMGLPPGSPAIDAIPPGVPGCTGSIDQRGVARPQGPGCDIGSFEVIVTKGDTQAPTVPGGLTVTATTPSAVSLSWTASSDNVGVTGYTIYRNGVAAGTTDGAGAVSFTDATVAPSTAYTYTVDAFDGSGNHSAQSKSVSVTTPAPVGIQSVQAGATSTSTPVSTTTIVLGSTVHAGDLLVGWFGQYGAGGEVQVSDNVNGSWIRSNASTTFSTGGGDLALYYFQDSAPAPWGLTITITATSPTYLEGAASEYSGIATAGALNQAVASSGSGTTVDSGATGAVGAGELVVGGIITGGSPGTVTPGSSQGKPFSLRVQTASDSAGLDDILASSAGAQDFRATLSAATDWHAAVGVFLPYGQGDTQAPSIPSGLATNSVASNTVSLGWVASTDNVGVAGYTVYRNGVSVGTTSTPGYTDSSLTPSTPYSYTVAAFDAAGNHSAQSSPLTVTTLASPPPSASWVQGGTIGTGTQVTSATLKLTAPVSAGALLTGWVGQYGAAGQVQVSDNVNGAWTRSVASTTFSNGGGDIALYYVQNATAAPAGLTITISASSPTYLEAALAEYSGVATAGALDQVTFSSGNSTMPDSGPTATVEAGELVIGAFITGGSPTSITAGSTQGKAFAIRSQSPSGSVALEDALSGAAGTQDARATFATATDWYAVVATFHTVSSP